MKSVLISINSKWCELIASGKKTVEVRKNKPKLDIPFNCYIYCRANSKVIGEFVCDRIVEFENSFYDLAFAETSVLSCVDWEELAMYIGKKDFGYGWHVSDLVIYDKPRELSEFFVWKKCNSCRVSGYESTACIYDENCKVPAVITRPPQSWCYVESEVY